MCTRLGTISGSTKCRTNAIHCPIAGKICVPNWVLYVCTWLGTGSSFWSCILIFLSLLVLHHSPSSTFFSICWCILSVGWGWILLISRCVYLGRMFSTAPDPGRPCYTVFLGFSLSILILCLSVLSVKFMPLSLTSTQEILSVISSVFHLLHEKLHLKRGLPFRLPTFFSPLDHIFPILCPLGRDFSRRSLPNLHG